MFDRLVRRADVVSLKCASYQLLNRGLDTLPTIRTTIGDALS